MAKRDWHYYESHITIFGEQEDWQIDNLLSLLQSLNLKVVDLVNIKRQGLQNEEFDVITTMHSSNLQDIVDKTKFAVEKLKFYNYPVVRYKIESTVYDSKHEDALELL